MINDNINVSYLIIKIVVDSVFSLLRIANPGESNLKDKK